VPQVNPLTRELLVKLVYYGPGLGGKTTSLQRIHAVSPSETRGQLVSLATPVDRTLYFDFLPLRIGPVRDHHVRLQLFTVPGQVYFNATRKLVLTGADGVVFVADSQRERHDANLESLENLASNLEEQDRSLAEIPLVFQYNKRDLPAAQEIETLDEALNAIGAKAIPTCATKGEGVLETLDALVQEVLEDLEARHALGDPSEPIREPKFDQSGSALENEIGRATEQMWRSAVDGAVVEARSAPDQTVRGDPAVLSAAAAQSAQSVPAAPPAEPSLRPAAPDVAVRSQPRGAGRLFTALFPDQADEVAAIEGELAAGRASSAIARCDFLALTLLQRVAAEAGLPQGPAAAAMMLGLGGDRWIAFRRLARRTRDGGPVDRREALEAYGLVIEIQLRSARAFA
jgi:signal recognition particle receptor subunit beta